MGAGGSWPWRTVGAPSGLPSSGRSPSLVQLAGPGEPVCVTASPRLRTRARQRARAATEEPRLQRNEGTSRKVRGTVTLERRPGSGDLAEAPPGTEMAVTPWESTDQNRGKSLSTAREAACQGGITAPECWGPVRPWLSGWRQAGGQCRGCQQRSHPLDLAQQQSHKTECPVRAPG